MFARGREAKVKRHDSVLGVRGPQVDVTAKQARKPVAQGNEAAGLQDRTVQQLVNGHRVAPSGASHLAGC